MKISPTCPTWSHKPTKYLLPEKSVICCNSSFSFISKDWQLSIQQASLTYLWKEVKAPISHQAPIPYNFHITENWEGNTIEVFDFDKLIKHAIYLFWSCTATF